MVGITAEGDNAVLMQKVAKELLGFVQRGVHPLHQIKEEDLLNWNVADLEVLLNLFKIREDRLLLELGNKMQEGVSKGKGIFEIWMKDESDLIQHTARAFGMFSS
jgi:acyl-CoA oxidase